MSERNGSTSVGTGTTEIPVVGAGAPAEPDGGPPAGEESAAEPQQDAAHMTAPVTVRPAPRMPRRGPLTVMGPWAPVAGALIGLLLGVVAVVLLGGMADTFEERLSLVFVVLGLG